MSNTYTSIKDLFHSLSIEETHADDAVITGFLTMLCAGYVHTAPASSCQYKRENAYLLLYTISGHGTASSKKVSYALSKDTLLFLPISSGIRITSSSSSWYFFACLISGSSMDTYYSCFQNANQNPYAVPVYSGIPSYIERLHLSNPGTDIICQMTISSLLSNLLTELCVDIHAQNVAKEHIPDYLLQLKSIFDTNCQKSFSLANYENCFGISRYRLCREFSHYFHSSPLQYLNHRRMEAAKDLLLSTSMTIHEVGSAVGIDNTNHFINLFKKNTGTTPLAYKQGAPASIRALHYPYKPDVPPQ